MDIPRGFCRACERYMGRASSCPYCDHSEPMLMYGNGCSWALWVIAVSGFSGLAWYGWFHYGHTMAPLTAQDLALKHHVWDGFVATQSNLWRWHSPWFSWALVFALFIKVCPRRLPVPCASRWHNILRFSRAFMKEALFLSIYGFFGCSLVLIGAVDAHHPMLLLLAGILGFMLGTRIPIKTYSWKPYLATCLLCGAALAMGIAFPKTLVLILIGLAISHVSHRMRCNNIIAGGMLLIPMALFASGGMHLLWLMFDGPMGVIRRLVLG